MNHPENNMIRCLKTTVFMIICLMVFSALTNTDSGNDSYRTTVLTSNLQVIPSQAILAPVKEGVTFSCPVASPGPHNLFILNYKPAFDSRIFNQRLLTLRKSREIISAQLNFRYYLRVISANPDDLPDLS